MLLVTCVQCHVTGFTEEHGDPDSAVACACCPQDHHHGNAASACAADHATAPCPVPDKCPVWLGTQPHAENSAQRLPSGPCPGGHHGLGVDGCTVCRPVLITLIPGSIRLQHVTGA